MANTKAILRKLNANGEKSSMDNRLEEEVFNKMKKQADVWEEENIKMSQLKIMNDIEGSKKALRMLCL